MAEGYKVASAYVPIDGDNTGFRRTLEQTRGLLTGFIRNVGQGISQGIGQALFGTISRAIGRGVGFIREGLKSASDLDESISKTAVAFGASAQSILDWSETSAQALGQSRQQA